MFRYLRSSLLIALLGVAGAGYLGFRATASLAGAASAAWVVAVLAVLEVSLSFDNAIINASVLKTMDAVWRRRFITWGMLIAVVGMRVVLPIAIVAVLGALSPWAAVELAVAEPAKYGAILKDAHVSVSAFGGAFLGMVGLQFFLNPEKDVHWIRVVEQPLLRLGRVASIGLGVVLLLLLLVVRLLPEAEQTEFLTAGILGLLSFIVVDGLAALIRSPGTEAVARSGWSSFLYLEVLDASFSFDGVIGAFALSTNLMVIALGLGIGALFVRSLTILFVEVGVLARFRYLEHGAFYAIVCLALVMFLQAIFHLPEAVSGLLGAGSIGLSLVSSVRHNRRSVG